VEFKEYRKNKRREENGEKKKIEKK